MAQTQLFASLKEHPKLSQTREFKIAIGLEDKYSTQKTFINQELQKVGVLWKSNLHLWGSGSKEDKGEWQDRRPF